MIEYDIAKQTFPGYKWEAIQNTCRGRATEWDGPASRMSGVSERTEAPNSIGQSIWLTKLAPSHLELKPPSTSLQLLSVPFGGDRTLRRTCRVESIAPDIGCHVLFSVDPTCIFALVGAPGFAFRLGAGCLLRSKDSHVKATQLLEHALDTRVPTISQPDTTQPWSRV